MPICANNPWVAKKEPGCSWAILHGADWLIWFVTPISFLIDERSLDNYKSRSNHAHDGTCGKTTRRHTLAPNLDGPPHYRKRTTLLVQALSLLLFCCCSFPFVLVATDGLGGLSLAVFWVPRRSIHVALCESCLKWPLLLRGASFASCGKANR